MTLLLRAGTNVATLDNNGRTPMQLAQSKLKLLQRHSNSGGAEMGKVKFNLYPFGSSVNFAISFVSAGEGK